MTELDIETPLRKWRSTALLLLAAAIWGFAFVAQRMGMEHVEPLTFTAARFSLGSIVLVPVLLVRRRTHVIAEEKRRPASKVLLGVGLAGVLLSAAITLQQVGIIYTTAGKAGFITGLYVVIVPLMGLLWGQRAGWGTWGGVFLAAIGLYLLSAAEGVGAGLGRGELLVLVSAFLWAGHVHIIGWLSGKVDAIHLAIVQFAICAALSTVGGVLLEKSTAAGLLGALGPILYAGVLSVGVAYTLQVVAQQDAPPAHAAVVLSLEGVFAVLGGWLVLGERLSLGNIGGCGLMLLGMLLSQLVQLGTE